MYFGNVSNFFYKNKEWLQKQPKISLGENSNNIIKIGKQYYFLNSSTGKFSLIKPKLSSIKMEPSSYEKKTSTLNKSQKGNTKYFQRTFNHTKKTPNPRMKNTMNTDFNSKNNLTIKSKISNSYSSCDDKNKSNEKTNIISSFDKSEKYLLKNEEINNYIYRKNTEESLKNKKRKSKRNSSLKLKINSEFMNSIIPKIENDEIKSKLKFKKFENNKIKQNNLLTKNNIKKLQEKKNNKEEFNSNITYVNCINNRPNLSKTLNNSNKYKKINYKIKTRKYNIKILSTFSPLDLNEKEFINKIFPNLESLDIYKDDSSYLRTIKDTLLKRRIYDDLNSKYKFYQDSNNKRDNNDIPKINFKKTIILNRKEIFPPKGPLHHKLYFNHVNRQRQNDNKLYDIDYPLIQVK
jgi:hypothetical protein